MGQHARLAPSAAERWMNCAGSLAMEEALPPKGSSGYADEGTAAHELAALAITNRNRCEGYIGSKMSNKWKVTPDMADDTQVYVDNILQYAEGNQLFVEQRLSIESITTEKDAAGTSDAVIITQDLQELQIHDLKFGRGIKVDAEYNRQLMIYALAALEAFGMIGEFKRVRLVIHQPRLNHLSEWDISVGDLLLFGRAVRAAAETALDIASQKRDMASVEVMPRLMENLDPGEDQCRWCAAKAICPALASKISKTIGAEFQDLTLMNNVTVLIPENNDLLADKMGAIDMIESWCKAVRAQVERHLLNGMVVPGYKIVQGKQGNRKWVDEDTVEEALKKMRLKKEEMYDFSLISPTKAEKLFKDNKRQWKKLEEFVTRSEGRPSVTFESDSRPAMNLRPTEEEFSDLTTEVNTTIDALNGGREFA